jgi:hypothetical protein
MWTLKIFKNNGTSMGQFSFSSKQNLENWIKKHVTIAQTRYIDDTRTCELFMSPNSIRS